LLNRISSQKEAKDLGLSPEEMAFYDALTMEIVN
jgi:hypothetical protein